METRIYFRVAKVMDDERIAMFWAEEFKLELPVTETKNGKEVVTGFKDHVIRSFEHFITFKPLEVKLNMAKWVNISKDKTKEVLKAGISMPAYIPQQCLLMLMENIVELTNGRKMVIICSDVDAPTIEFEEVAEKAAWKQKLEAYKSAATPAAKPRATEKDKSSTSALDAREQARARRFAAKNQ